MIWDRVGDEGGGEYNTEWIIVLRTIQDNMDSVPIYWVLEGGWGCCTLHVGISEPRDITCCRIVVPIIEGE